MAQNKKPLRIAIAGLTHAHVHWLLGRPDRGDVQLVGIVEPNKVLAQRYADRHKYSMDIVFNSLTEMIEKTKPEAVAAFGTIFQHLEVVQTCAPLGIHVMVEKPLAVSLDHAKKMKLLADKYKILLLTNYETTWYATNHKAYEIVHKDKAIGDLRKVVIHDGHQGPKEIGVNKEFLDWLTDPVQNGGGAITDFGCYGANLITWLTKGKKPESVLAMTQQLKPDIYPKVDDEATILLQYPAMQELSRHPGIGPSVEKIWKCMVKPELYLVTTDQRYAFVWKMIKRNEKIFYKNGILHLTIRLHFLLR